MASRLYPSQAPDLVCECKHTGRDHCDDGECIHGGVAGDGVSFACGCTRWRPQEVNAKKAVGEIWLTEDGRAIPVETMADSHVVNALRCFRAVAVALALSPDPDDSVAARRARLQAQIDARVSMMEREATRRGLDV